MQTLLVVLGIVALGLGVTVLSQRDLRRHPWAGSGGGGPFGPIDEIFAPTRHEAMAELKEQFDRAAPAPAPGEPPWLEVDLDRGTATLRPLPETSSEALSTTPAEPDDDEPPPHAT